MHGRFAALAVAGLLGWAASAAAQEDTVASTAITVRAGEPVALGGRVLDARTGQPLRAAGVRLPGARVSVYTDEQGRFSAKVQPGTYGAAVGLLGYRPRAEIWTVDAADTARVIRLEPDPVVLQGLRVQVRRIERRVRAAGTSARAWDRDALVQTSYPTVEEFVMVTSQLTRSACGSFATSGGTAVGTGRAPGSRSGGAECVRVRGVATRPCVIVDEAPSGMDLLGSYRPQELYRLEVYHGGSVIVAYTVWFAESVARRRVAIPPLETITAQLCGTR